LPRTLDDDGDPLDVLLLMDKPAFPGSTVTIRNDRIVAVAEANHMYADIKKLDDLPRRFLTNWKSSS
jgi:inorganic pyrophosphatase